jgi:hypothetical protein
MGQHRSRWLMQRVLLQFAFSVGEVVVAALVAAAMVLLARMLF